MSVKILWDVREDFETLNSILWILPMESWLTLGGILHYYRQDHVECTASYYKILNNSRQDAEASWTKSYEFSGEIYRCLFEQVNAKRRFKKDPMELLLNPEKILQDSRQDPMHKILQELYGLLICSAKDPTEL